MMSQHLTFVHLNMARLFVVYSGIPEARRMRNAWVRDSPLRHCRL